MHHNRHYNHFYSRSNHKKLWKATGMSFAFKNYLDYYVRIPALRVFYKVVEQTIKKVFALQEQYYETDDPKKVKAQLSICYSNYPANLATLAAIGHTAWIQNKKLRSGTSVISGSVPQDIRVGEAIYRTNSKAFVPLCKAVEAAVDERLTMEELSKSGLEQSIEAYRFFLTSNNNLRFESMPRIIRTAILFGDLMPPLDNIKLYPLTKEILTLIHSVSSKYYREIETAQTTELPTIGKIWIEELCLKLIRYLPKVDHRESVPRNLPRKHDFASPEGLPKSPDENFPGFDQPQPPMVEEPKIEDFFKSSATDCLGNPLTGCSGSNIEDLPKPLKEMMQDIAEAAKTITGASDQSSKFEEIRSDILLEDILNNPFEAGPVEGTPAEGNEVEVDMGENGKVKGQIYDQAFELSFDLQAIDELIEEARPLSNRMKKNIFPNKEQVPVVENLRSSGMLDQQRLANHKFSEALFKRFINTDLLDKKGKPVVLIVCDGSGSMTSDKMHMLKILTTAWVHSTLRTSVQIMAGMYTTGYANKRNGPIVYWIYHPTKTPASSKREALRALASIPTSGMGGQQDALSLGYMLGEADKLARGKRIYMIHITDTGYCNSFNKGLTAEEEVESVLRHRKETAKDNFHYTLVGLGVHSGGSIERVADKMICLPPGELTNPYKAASRIGIYVSSCIKERSKVIN